VKYRALLPGVPEVSLLSLGSWHTFSRLSFDENLLLVRRALELGVNFFDVGYYWDKPDTEQVFGSALRKLGVARSDYVLALKLWLWDYPARSFATQVEASLQRLQLDEVDLVMVSRPGPEVGMEAFLQEVTALIDKGLARGWGITNWEPWQLQQALPLLARQRLPMPRLLQLQYNVARRCIVEDPQYDALFASGGIGLCAANVLEGGILAGHLDRDRVNPSEFARGVLPNERNICRDSGGIRAQIRAMQPRLAQLAGGFGLTAAQAALAVVLAHPALCTALVGVTRAPDLRELCTVVDRDDWPEVRAALDHLAIAGTAHPKLFSPTQENA
jgi:L-glyceraldehyde 3-phosphate reductase